MSPNPVQVKVWLDHWCGTWTPVEDLRRGGDDQRQRKDPHNEWLHGGDGETVWL